MIEGRKTRGLDGRTTRHASYAVSQRKRKRVEEIFGWMKAYGGLRRTLARGLRRVQLHAYLVGAAYNLLRLARLRPLTGEVCPETARDPPTQKSTAFSKPARLT